jgi:hypothetical protein
MGSFDYYISICLPIYKQLKITLLQNASKGILSRTGKGVLVFGHFLETGYQFQIEQTGGESLRHCINDI